MTIASSVGEFVGLPQKTSSMRVSQVTQVMPATVEEEDGLDEGILVARPDTAFSSSYSLQQSRPYSAIDASDSANQSHAGPWAAAFCAEESKAAPDVFPAGDGIGMLTYEFCSANGHGSSRDVRGLREILSVHIESMEQAVARHNQKLLHLSLQSISELESEVRELREQNAKLQRQASPRGKASYWAGCPAPRETLGSPFLAKRPSFVQQPAVPTAGAGNENAAHSVHQAIAAPGLRKVFPFEGSDPERPCVVTSDIPEPLEMGFSKDGPPGRPPLISEAWEAGDARTTAVSPPPEKPTGPTTRNTVVTPVFADFNGMKDKIRESIGKVEYNVFDRYHETGWAQKIAKSKEFEYGTMLIVAFNALWMAVETDHNPAQVIINASILFKIMEGFFCCFFFIEWAIRLAAFRHKCDAPKDQQFLFDSVLLFIMFAENWGLTFLTLLYQNKGTSLTDTFDPSILRLFRVARVMRVTRVVKLLKTFPELMVLIKGMVTATRSVFFTLCLLVLILYVWGIFFTSVLRGQKVGDRYFTSVGVSMNSLLLHACFLEDFPEMANAVFEESSIIYALLLLFVLLAALTVMNMLVGVLVEVVSVVAAVEKEQLAVEFMREKMMEVLALIRKKKIEDVKEVTIDKDDFMAILSMPSAARVLRDVGIDVVALVDLVDYIFNEDEGTSSMNFKDFMELMLQMRGSNIATVRDLVDTRKYLKQLIGKLEIPVSLPTSHQRLGSITDHGLAEFGEDTSSTTGSRKPSLQNNLHMLEDV